MNSINFQNRVSEDPKLPKNWLTVTRQVQSLYFDYVICSIEKDAFNTNHFANLLNLTFQGCFIKAEDGTFNGLENLRTLSLYDMKYIKFPPKILAPLQSLEEFTLEKCPEEEISVISLFGTINLPTIKKVEISSCNLASTITEHTFVGLKNISELILVNNQIDQIGPRSFDAIYPTLKHLNLMKNFLKSLPISIFTKALQNHVKIDLQRNPWHCDCDLEDFRSFLQQEQRNIKHSDIICATPSDHAGKELKCLSYLCPPPTELPVARSVDKKRKNSRTYQRKIDLSGTGSEDIFIRLTRPASDTVGTHTFF